MNKLYEKGCKEDPMFVTIVKQKNTIQPDASTSYYLYVITGEQKYLDQTMDLETDPFKKAKLYYIAANEASKAGGAGSKYVESYNAKAPTKSEIFAEGNAGQSIKIGCWIGRSVTVPNL